MRIVEWAPVIWTDTIPPFGAELEKHLFTTKQGGESYAVWNLLYTVLKKNDIKIEKVKFTNKGKPFFIDNHVFFSIAHTKGVCAVSISDVPTGVDIERFDRNIIPKIQRRVFSSEEIDLYFDEPVIAWCRKEATAKMNGQGILDASGKYTICEKKIVYVDDLIDIDGVKYVVSSCYRI